MKKSKWHPFLFICLTLLLIISAVACGELTFDTYQNDDWAYTIRYPKGWVVDESTSPAPGVSITSLWARTSRISGVGIAVYDLSIAEVESNAEVAAQMYLEEFRQRFDNVLILDNGEMQSKWDWHLSLELDGFYNKEMYFLHKDGYFCSLQISCPKEDYDLYPWDEIIESFAFEPALLPGG